MPSRYECRGSASSGSTGAVTGGSGATNSTGLSNNRAGSGVGPGGRFDGVTNPLPPVPGDAAIKAEDAKVDAKVKGICKGC